MGQYWQGIVQNIPMNIQMQQEQIRCCLSRKWSVEVHGNLRSYQDLALKMVEEIFSIDHPKYPTNAIILALSFCVPNKKVFVITDYPTMPAEDQKEDVMEVVLRSKVRNMRGYKRMRLLNHLLHVQEFLIDLCGHRSHRFLSNFFPWEEVFLDSIFQKMQRCLSM